MNRADWNGNSPLHLAAMFGQNKAMIDFLVHECNCSVDEQDENGATALHHAVFNVRSRTSKKEKIELNMLLLGTFRHNGCLVQFAGDGQRRRSRWIVSIAARKHAESFRYLLLLDLVNLCQMFVSKEIARFLKDDKKADIGAFNARGDTVLWGTIQNRNDELMNLLLKDERTDLSRKLGINSLFLFFLFFEVFLSSKGISISLC